MCIPTDATAQSVVTHAEVHVATRFVTDIPSDSSSALVANSDYRQEPGAGLVTSRTVGYRVSQESCLKINTPRATHSPFSAEISEMTI